MDINRTHLTELKMQMSELEKKLAEVIKNDDAFERAKKIKEVIRMIQEEIKKVESKKK